MSDILAFLHHTPFHEVTALLLLAALTGGAGLALRQPMVVSFLVVGVLAGPSMLGIVQADEHINLLAEIGIALLLFLVGLKLDVQLIRTLGAVSLATGLGQVVLTTGAGFGLALALGFDAVTALYLGVALTFSSTIIVIKLLSDSREIDALHGRIAVGLLIVQDIVVVLAMLVLSAFGAHTADTPRQDAVGQVLLALGNGSLMLVGVGLFIRYAANPLMQKIGQSQELLVVFAISWSMALATLGDVLGFSKELGGLLAGMSLASTPFREAIISRLSSLRDFLLLFFFVSLGSQMDLGLLGRQIGPALVLSAFVLLCKPLIVMAMMGIMGYRKRTGLLTGLTVAQISEFSLIFIAMGLSLGHITSDALGVVTLVGLLTIALSVYMITYAHALYRWLEPFLDAFERRMPQREQAAEDNSTHGQHYDVIVFGLGRYGTAIADCLLHTGQHLLLVDFDPDVVRRWRDRGHDAVYGDACDPEFVATLPLRQAQWVIAAMPHHDRGLLQEDPRLILMRSLKDQGYGGRIAVTTHIRHDTAMLHDKGADLVFLPFHEAAERAVERMGSDIPSPSGRGSG
jgi:Kef-type K+ transport system membrane component KefB